MMRQEFVERLGHDVPDEEWPVIETVYGWHPLVPDRGGKEVIAKLYRESGFGLIRDMLPTAETLIAADRERRRYAAAQTQVREEMRAREAAFKAEQGRAVSQIAALANEEQRVAREIAAIHAAYKRG